MLLRLFLGGIALIGVAQAAFAASPDAGAKPDLDEGLRREAVATAGSN